MNNFKIISLTIVFAFVLKARAQDNVFTLQQAIDYALTNQFQAKNADLDITKAKKKIWETTSIGLPQVNGGFDYQNNIDLAFDLEVPDPIPPGQEFILLFAAQHNTTAKINVSQLVFDGTYIVGLQAAKTYADLSKIQKEQTLVEIKQQVASSYYLALVSVENHKMLSKSNEVLDQNIKETKALFEQGFVEETDLDQLELLKSNLEINLINAENQKKISYKMLQLNMGFPLDESIVLSDSLLGIIDKINVEDILKTPFTAANNAEFKVLEVQEDLLELDVRRYQMQRLPTIGAFYQAQGQAYQTEFDFYKEASWFNSQTAGLSVSIPIFSSGMHGAKISQAKIELEKMQNSKKFFEESLKLQYDNANNNLNVNYLSYLNAKKSMDIAQKILDKTRIKYKEGVAGSFELTQIENQFIEAQGNYINNLFKLLNSKVELDKLLNKN